MNDLGLNEFLEKLGLTEYESKTLSTLFKLKEAEAPAVSRLAQVPKTRVYDVLDKLIKKGLIIEIHGRPKKYRVIDSNEAIDLLIEGRKQEINELESGAIKIKNMVSFSGDSDEEGEKVMKVKDKQDFDRILGQEIEKAEKEVLGLSEIKNGQQLLYDTFSKLKNKNVAVKLCNSLQSDAIKKISKQGVNVKHLNHGLNIFLIDGKKIVMALSDFKRDKPEYHFTIWNNKPMASALQHYFQKCWQQGKNL